MKIKETTLSMGRTINLGNFESLRLDLSVTLDVDARLSEEEYSSLVRELEGTLSRNIDAVSARQTGKPEEEIEEFI